jgi:hypothetical protein
MPMTHEQRSLRSRLGAYTMHSRGLTNTEPARAAFMARLSARSILSDTAFRRGRSEPRRGCA